MKEISTLSADKVDVAVQALKSLIKTDSGKKKLFEDDYKPILLQVTCVKIPDVKCSGILRPKLPHSVVSKSSDVCLITADLKKGIKINHEPTVNYYNQVLNRHNCDALIKQIVPFRQIRAEFSTYEMKRKFANMYDFYLADGRISERLIKLLGKPFFKNRKFPIPVKFDDNVGEHIKSALHKTHLLVDGKGQTSIVLVGHTNMKSDEIAENIVAVGNFLAEKYPGGWKNVRCLHLKLPTSKAVPLFMNLISKNDVPRPTWEKPKPKAAVPVTDYVDTCSRKVTVMPDGNVILGDIEDSETESTGLLDDDLADFEEVNETKLHTSILLTAQGKKESIKRKIKDEVKAPKEKKKKKELDSVPKEDVDEVNTNKKKRVEINDVEEEYLNQWKQKYDKKMEKIEEKLKKREEKRERKKQMKALSKPVKEKGKKTKSEGKKLMKKK